MLSSMTLAPVASLKATRYGRPDSPKPSETAIVIGFPSRWRTQPIPTHWRGTLAEDFKRDCAQRRACFLAVTHGSIASSTDDAIKISYGFLVRTGATRRKSTATTLARRINTSSRHTKREVVSLPLFLCAPPYPSLTSFPFPEHFGQMSLPLTRRQPALIAMSDA